MEITPKRLHEFQVAYEQDFGESITTNEAQEMLNRLVTLYERVMRPLPVSKDEASSHDQPEDFLS
jgi:hypothetical protein